MYQSAQHIYFNQKLLNYNQKFVPDPDYIFLLQDLFMKNTFCVLQSILPCMKYNQVKPLQEQLREITIKKLITSDNAFLFVSKVKETPAYWTY